MATHLSLEDYIVTDVEPISQKSFPDNLTKPEKTLQNELSHSVGLLVADNQKWQGHNRKYAPKSVWHNSKISWEESKQGELLKTYDKDFSALDVGLPKERNSVDFDLKLVLLNENWTDIFHIQSIVTSIDKELIQCECLIDKEGKLFETRSFPRVVFNQIKNLSKNQPVLISIKSKPGSIRIDVIDGKNFVDQSLFSSNKSWQLLETKFQKKSIKAFKTKDA